MTDYGRVAVKSKRFNNDLDLKYYINIDNAPYG